ncbi:MAG TPA: DUF433 domain-containing protein [Phycisphaerae bacterium]|jgi:uncharacterized protein (DUF433 family)
MSITETGHIVLDERGIPWIDGTNVKVIEVVLDKLAHGSSPEEMHLQYPHLSVAQICAAMTWYYDHQVEMDADIERGLQEYRALRDAGGESPGRKRLRERGSRS